MVAAETGQRVVRRGRRAGRALAKEFGASGLPELVQLIWDRKINPGRVFDLPLPLDRAAEGYQARDQRTAVKVLLTV